MDSAGNFTGEYRDTRLGQEPGQPDQESVLAWQQSVESRYPGRFRPTVGKPLPGYEQPEEPKPWYNDLIGIGKEAVNRSIEGLAYQFGAGPLQPPPQDYFGRPDYTRQKSQVAPPIFDTEKYHLNRVENIGAEVLSFLSPGSMLLFGVGGGLGGVLAKQGIEKLAGKMVARKVAQGLTEDAAKEFVAKTINSVAEKVIAHGATASGGLMTYGGTRDILAKESKTPGEFFLNRLKEAGLGTVIGVGGGVVPEGANALTRTAAEVGTGTLAMGVGSPIMEGRTPTGEDLGNALGTMVGLTVGGKAIRLPGEMKTNWKINSALRTVKEAMAKGPALAQDEGNYATRVGTADRTGMPLYQMKTIPDGTSKEDALAHFNTAKQIAERNNGKLYLGIDFDKSPIFDDLKTAGVISSKPLKKGGYYVKTRQLLASEALDKALADGVINKQTHDVGKSIVSQNPDFDLSNIMQFNDVVNEATPEVLMNEGYTGKEKGQILGETKSGIKKTLMQFFKGANAETIVHENLHAYYDRMPEAAKKLYAAHADKLGRKPAELFAEEGTTAVLANGWTGIKDIDAMFDKADESLASIVENIKKFKATEVPPEIMKLYRSAMLRKRIPKSKGVPINGKQEPAPQVPQEIAQEVQKGKEVPKERVLSPDELPFKAAADAAGVRYDGMMDFGVKGRKAQLTLTEPGWGTSFYAKTPKDVAIRAEEKRAAYRAADEAKKLESQPLATKPVVANEPPVGEPQVSKTGTSVPEISTPILPDKTSVRKKRTLKVSKPKPEVKVDLDISRRAASDYAHSQKDLKESLEFLAEAKREKNAEKIKVGEESVTVNQEAVERSREEYNRIIDEMTKSTDEKTHHQIRIIAREEAKKAGMLNKFREMTGRWIPDLIKQSKNLFSTEESKPFLRGMIEENNLEAGTMAKLASMVSKYIGNKKLMTDEAKTQLYQDILDGKNPDIAAMNDYAFNELVKAGVLTDKQKVKNYLHRVIKEDIWKILNEDMATLSREIAFAEQSGNYTDEVIADKLKTKSEEFRAAIKYVMQSDKKIRTLAQAANSIKQNIQSNIFKQYSFEKRRTQGLPSHFYETDPHKIIPQYIKDVSRRLAQAKVWGVNGERGIKILEDIHKANPEEYKTAMKLLAMSNGQYEMERDLKGRLKTAVDTYVAIEYGLKIGLGRATILNLAQPAISMIPDLGLWNTIRGGIALMSPELRQKIRLSGAINQYMMEALLGYEPSTKWIKFGKKMGTYTGFTTVNKGLQYLAASTFEQAANKWVNLAKGGLRAEWAKKRLADYDLDWKRPIPEDKMVRAMYRFAQNSQLQKNLLNEPLIMNDPHYRVFFLFKRFGYKQMNYIREMMWRETIERQNYFPALRLIVAGYAGGEFINWGLNHIQSALSGQPVYRKDEELTWKRAIKNLGTIGAFGMASDMFATEKLSDIGGKMKFITSMPLGTDWNTIWDSYTSFMKDWENYGDAWYATTRNAYKFSGVFGSMLKYAMKRTISDKQQHDQIMNMRTDEKGEIIQLIIDGHPEEASHRLQKWQKAYPERGLALTQNDIDIRAISKRMYDNAKKRLNVKVVDPKERKKIEDKLQKLREWKQHR